MTKHDPTCSQHLNQPMAGGGECSCQLEGDFAWLRTALDDTADTGPDVSAIRMAMQVAEGEAWLSAQLHGDKHEMAERVMANLRQSVRAALQEQVAHEEPTTVVFRFGQLVRYAGLAAAACVAIVFVVMQSKVPNQSTNQPVAKVMAEQESETALDRFELAAQALDDDWSRDVEELLIEMDTLAEDSAGYSFALSTDIHDWLRSSGSSLDSYFDDLDDEELDDVS